MSRKSSSHRASAQTDDSIEPDEASSSIADMRLAALAILLVVLAVGMWASRNFVSSQFAGAYTAIIELTLPADGDDARLAQALAVAERSAGAATLELSKSPTRFPGIDIRASSRSQALARARAFSQALVTAFDAQRAGHLEAEVYGTAYPVEDAASRTVWIVLASGAAVLGLAAIACFWLLWRRQQTGPEPTLPQIVWVPALSIGLPAALLVLPGWGFMALFAMVIPCAIAWKILSMAGKARSAAGWPSAQGRVVRSQTRAVHNERSGGGGEVADAPDIEYVFSVGGIEHRGQRIGIADIVPGSAQVQAALDRYRVGWIGPVFYNPANPDDAVLDRKPPRDPKVLVFAAALTVLVGLAVVATFAGIGDIIRWLTPYFPAGAIIPLVLFCLLCGSMTAIFLLLDLHKAWAAARWPQARGEILSSAPQAEVAPSAAHTTVTMWSPAVEYSYSAGGRDHHGARIALGADVRGARAFAERTCARYPKGSAVTVYYDPANPGFAVLEPKVAFAWATFLISLGFFTGAVFAARLF